MQDFNDIIDYLPEIVQEMVRLIGLNDTQKLIEHFGGAEFCFTDGAYYFPRLKALLGKESAVILLQYFQSERVYIPRCEAGLRMLRNRQVLADFNYLTEQKGLSARLAMLELCSKYKLSDRRLWEILQELRAQRDTQPVLF